MKAVFTWLDWKKRRDWSVWKDLNSCLIHEMEQTSCFSLLHPSWRTDQSLTVVLMLLRKTLSVSDFSDFSQQQNWLLLLTSVFPITITSPEKERQEERDCLEGTRLHLNLSLLLLLLLFLFCFVFFLVSSSFAFLFDKKRRWVTPSTTHCKGIVYAIINRLKEREVSTEVVVVQETRYNRYKKTPNFALLSGKMFLLFFASVDILISLFLPLMFPSSSYFSIIVWGIPWDRLIPKTFSFKCDSLMSCLLKLIFCKKSFLLFAVVMNRIVETKTP